MINKINYKKNQITLSLISPLIVLTISIIACGIAPLAGNNSDNFIPTVAPPKPNPIYEAEIFFWVTIPENTPEGSEIEFVIIDEVTGSLFNQTRVKMAPVDTTHYGVVIQAIVGSVIKYRYERSGSGNLQETLNNNEDIRYRFYHVTGPGEVQDSVAKWIDTDPIYSSGRITGFAYNASTGKPLPNVYISAGGASALTQSDGFFILSPLTPGQHTLVAYSIDGSYQTFQQNAIIAVDSATPVSLPLEPTKFVDVTFVMHSPDETIAGVPVRIAGNLYQFGNTFANNIGFISGLVSRMPVLTPVGDGRFTITMSLPTGIDIRYKYTLGDGFINAEHNANSSFAIRQLIIPEDSPPILIEDWVVTWKSGNPYPIWFDVSTPAWTSPEDQIYLSYKLIDWMPPIPMWNAGENRWAYLLLSPTNIGQELTYKYCRNAQCSMELNLGWEALAQPRTVSFNLSEIYTAKDTISGWEGLIPSPPAPTVLTNPVAKRADGFIAGVALHPGYDVTWETMADITIDTIQEMNANQIIFQPSWSAVSNQPQVFFAQKPGLDMNWLEINREINLARYKGFSTAIFPQMQFPTGYDIWWDTAEINETWWQVWFERYKAFILHHADLAETMKVDTLIIGGDWLEPALPPNASPGTSGRNQPGNIEAIWKGIITEVRGRFSGKIAWYFPYDSIGFLPSFIDQVDLIYLQWGAPLASSKGASVGEMQSKAGSLLDEEVYSLQVLTGKPIILSLAYPSADGGATACLPPIPPASGCLPLAALSPLNPDVSQITLDLQEQVDIYNAILAAVNERAWVNGVVTEGFLPPLGLHDKSTSIHGKPAQYVLAYWFSQFVGE